MKSKFHLALLCGFFTLAITACTTPAEESKPIDIEKAKVEVQAMEDAYAAAEKAKDAAGVAAYYSADAVSYGRNSKPLVGKDAIQADIATQMAKDSSGNYNVYKLVDLFAEGNMAVEIGSWTVLNTAGTEMDNGHYMSFFQKRDGKYVCVRDMNVSSTPAKPME